MKRQARQSRAGFTLLELVLVMIILLTAVAMAAPSLRGWARGSKLRNSADEFLTLTRYGRTMSITEATLYRLEIDATAGTFQLKKQTQMQQQAIAQQGRTFAEIPGHLGEVKHVPEGGQMELTVESNLSLKDSNDNLNCIDFYPNGRTQTAKVRISDGSGFEITILCDSPAEDFYVSYEGTTQGR